MSETQKAVVIMHQMSAEEEACEIARLQEKAIRDERSAMNYARREGREEVLSKLRSKGFTDEQIQDLLN